ncbi:glycosyltransferase family 4 protein [Spirosoma sp. KNUC1025]|uniref:glycosyltransferase family 4 protein n=1 Tax=Spirosoma sp. KNUC1025 TaxID=2894082 RepID=UPI0038678325|nr:glycosyltransferase family 4 protein [Spirosoma sp. KNUC1025]
MKKPKRALLVFFNGKSNAGGAERMVQYFDDYLQSRGLKTEILDEAFLLNTFLGKFVKCLLTYRHFKKRKEIYLARLTSAYLWTRKSEKSRVVSNGESTPFFPVDLVISQGCYHVMERDYGRQSDKLSRVANLQRLGCLRAKQIITVTEKVKRDLVTYYELPPEKIQIVSSRVDTDFFKPLPQLPSAKKTVLYAGRLEPGKGLKDVQKLASIIERQNEWKLLIACNNPGNTELFDGLKNTQVIIGLGLETINSHAYSKADIVFFPSLSESFGMITIEALSAGVPVVATPVGIVPELVARHFPGVTVLEPFEDEAILHRFSEIVKTFRATVNRDELHELVKNEFGIESYRARLDEVLDTSFLGQ